MMSSKSDGIQVSSSSDNHEEIEITKSDASKRKAKQYKCSYCPQVYSDIGLFVAHKKSHQPKTSTNQENVKIKKPESPFISVQFPARCSTKRHLLPNITSSDHTALSPLYGKGESSECKKMKLFNIPAPPTNTPPPDLKAQQQQAYAAAAAAVVRPYACNFCDMRFGESYLLSAHILTHKMHREDGSKYMCIQCDKTFSIHANFKMHLSLHAMENAPPLNFKNYTNNFSQFGGFNKYPASPFLPQISHDKTIDMPYMQNLQKPHDLAIGRPYTCDICDKNFTQMGNLKTHLQTHSKEKPYKCDICGKGFTQLGNMKTHLKTHSKEKPYKCETCKKSFKTKSYAKVHIEKCNTFK